DTLVMCLDDTIGVLIPTLTYSNGCGTTVEGVLSSMLETITPDCNYELTRSWFFERGAELGGDTTVQHVITVMDTIRPVLPVFAQDTAIIYGCGVQAFLDALINLSAFSKTATDNCSGDIIANPTVQ